MATITTVLQYASLVLPSLDTLCWFHYIPMSITFKNTLFSTICFHEYITRQFYRLLDGIKWDFSISFSCTQNTFTLQLTLRVTVLTIFKCKKSKIPIWLTNTFCCIFMNSNEWKQCPTGHVNGETNVMWSTVSFLRLNRSYNSVITSILFSDKNYDKVTWI